MADLEEVADGLSTLRQACAQRRLRLFVQLRWYYILGGQLGQDWGICANPESPRAGLLTFEHQGCPQYEANPLADK